MLKKIYLSKHILFKKKYKDCDKISSDVLNEYALPYKTVHRIMKQNTTCKIGKDSVEQISIFLESMIKDVTLLSSIYTNHDKRKTITSEDVNLAIKTILTNTYAER